MSSIDTYNIELRNMVTDVANYEFELDDCFFSLLEDAEIKKGNLHVNLQVRKTSGFYMFNFDIAGVVTTVCDRCLDDMDVEIDTTGNLKVKYGEEAFDDGETVVVSESDSFLNVAWHIYEIIVLGMPINHTHEEGECNAEMLEKLNEHICTVSLNQTDNVEDKPVDPRWKELEKIINSNN